MLYFAYGSNLNHFQMKRRCKDSFFLKKYELKNYRLNLFEEQEDIQDHPIREQEIQAEYFPTPFNEIY